MNANAKKWVEALRSGEYKQTDEELRDEYGFCCLGVACELYAAQTGEEWVKADGRWFFGGKASDLPPSVAEWLGLTDGEGSFNGQPVDGEPATLWRVNDSGKSFAEIADLIESEPEGLFA